MKQKMFSLEEIGLVMNSSNDDLKSKMAKWLASDTLFSDDPYYSLSDFCKKYPLWCAKAIASQIHLADRNRWQKIFEYLVTNVDNTKAEILISCCANLKHKEDRENAYWVIGGLDFTKLSVDLLHLLLKKSVNTPYFLNLVIDISTRPGMKIAYFVPFDSFADIYIAHPKMRDGIKIAFGKLLYKDRGRNYLLQALDAIGRIYGHLKKVGDPKYVLFQAQAEAIAQFLLSTTDWQLLTYYFDKIRQMLDEENGWDVEAIMDLLAAILHRQDQKEALEAVWNCQHMFWIESFNGEYKITEECWYYLLHMQERILANCPDYGHSLYIFGNSILGTWLKEDSDAPQNLDLLIRKNFAENSEKLIKYAAFVALLPLHNAEETVCFLKYMEVLALKGFGPKLFPEEKSSAIEKSFVAFCKDDLSKSKINNSQWRTLEYLIINAQCDYAEEIILTALKSDLVHEKTKEAVCKFCIEHPQDRTARKIFEFEIMKKYLQEFQNAQKLAKIAALLKEIV